MNEVRFVNRNDEIKTLKNWCSRFRYTPLYIYGPEGCGKTRLLKEFVKAFDEFFGENTIAVYIDALERHSLDKAIVVPKSMELARDIVLTLVEKLGGPVGKVIAENITTILEKAIIKRRLEDNYILVVIDDITRAIGLDQIEWYVKWLFETMNKLNEEYRPRAINFIVTTSEGMSRRLIARHRHAEILLIWNLDKESFEELFYEIRPPTGIKFEDVWYLLGGNPGKLLELADRYDWNIDKMLRYYRIRIREIVEIVIKEGLVNELKRFVENIILAEKIINKRMGLLEEILEETNLILYKYWILLTLDSEVFERIYPEIGIGKKYAWQVPIYRKVVKEILDEIENMK